MTTATAINGLDGKLAGVKDEAADGGVDSRHVRSGSGRWWP